MAQYKHLHDWNVTPREAVELQKRLREQVRLEPLKRKIETIAGADISFNKYEPTIYAGIVVLRLPSLEVIEEVGVVGETKFPYVPGLLSFRELPAVAAAWERLERKPDVLIFDGVGYAHPRRFGIACHGGVLLDLPTIGCAKSILVGTHEPLGEEAGAQAPLVHRGEVVGMALRTRAGVSPVYVSIGHLMDLPTAVAIVRSMGAGYREPETTRRAHRLVNEMRKSGKGVME